tara:strand:+ start:5539 stop:5724 length:186 start_codon:yes stop_codon:yes gene_type:complete
MRYLSSIFTLVKKYLINLWIRDSSDLITTIEWEWDSNVESLILEVSKSLPNGIRATIEEKC